METIHEGTTSKPIIMIQVIIGSLIAGILFWVIESFIEMYFFSHHGDMPDWLNPHDSHTLVHRLKHYF
jgi:hypothetical protein